MSSDKGGGGDMHAVGGVCVYVTSCSFPYWIDRPTCQVSRMSLGTGFLTSTCFIWFYLEISRSKHHLSGLCSVASQHNNTTLSFYKDAVILSRGVG